MNTDAIPFDDFGEFYGWIKENRWQYNDRFDKGMWVRLHKRRWQRIKTTKELYNRFLQSKQEAKQ
jgi:hypothetical protein